MYVVAVAVGIGDISAAVLRTVGPYVLSANSYELRGGHLLSHRCDGGNGNYREAALGSVCGCPLYYC